LDGAFVTIASASAQIDAAVDPALIPVPNPLNIDAVALGRISGVFGFPHSKMLRGHSKSEKPSLSHLSYHVLCQEFGPLDLLLDPVLFVDLFREIRPRIDELDDSIRLPWAVHNLLFEEETIGVSRAVVLLVRETAVKFGHVGA